MVEQKKSGKRVYEKATEKTARKEKSQEIKTSKANVVEQPQVQISQTQTTEQADQDIFFPHKLILIIAIAALLLFNQYQIGTVTGMLGVSVPLNMGSSSSTLHLSSGEMDLSSVDVTQIKSTAQGIALLFPVGDIKTTDDAIAVMVPSGTPEYGEAMGISYDDPLTALSKLKNGYSALKQQAKQDDTLWQRYLALAAAPRGISCEFCCGVGPQGVDASGELKCGCAHNPAIQGMTLWLMMNTDYSDAEILREDYRWKSLWFPKNMVTLAVQIAGGDTSVLQDLPGMVGGC